MSLIELPGFDTAEYESHELHMVEGNAHLFLKITDLPDFKIHFRRVRWHQYARLHSCDPAWIKEAYFRLVEVSPNELSVSRS